MAAQGGITTTTYYLFPHYELEMTGSTGTIRRYYFFAGQPIAQKVGGRPLTYLHTDHLGSTVLTTGVTGNQKYHAYGATRSGLVKTEHQFTGHETDSTGLIYMQARYYDPVIGQFISPDTIVPDPNNLYAYNRYMYVYGNPLKYSDPNGHCVLGLDTIVCIVAAFAAAGGIAGFTGSVIGQGYEQWDEGESWKGYKDSLDISWAEAGIAGGAGAIGAGAAPLTGPVGFIGINALAGAGQQVATDVLLDGQSVSDSLTDPSLFAAAGISAAGAVIGGGPASKSVAHVVSSTGDVITYATGTYAAAIGGEQFAQVTGSMLMQKQLGEATASRGFVAGIITNLSLPDLSWPDLSLPDWMTWWWPWGEEPTTN